MSTTYDLIPAEVPSYAISTELARSMNEDAAAGISTGFPASIRIKANKFRTVDGNGEETVIKVTELADGEFLPIVVLAAKRGLNKTYYATAYDPNQAEPSAPDCFSLDGEKPDASVKSPQCKTCAACPQNAFGSGRNAAGQATKGKACADSKILAVLYKGGVYQFKIPPASLKNWGVFVKNLTARGVPLGHVVIYVGFDDKMDYSVFTFRVGAFVPEGKLGYLAEVAAGSEVRDITHPVAFTAAEKPAKEAAPAAKPAPVNPFGDAPAQPETIEKPKAKPRVVKKDEAPPAEEPDVPSDDELSSILGL